MFSHANLVWYYYRLVGASALDDLAFPSHALSTCTTVYKYKMSPGGRLFVLSGLACAA